jgi:mannose-1-phosphate guanylyltransferase
MAPPHSWAVILAGGDGARLRPLTRLLTGDDRPKQFCPLAGPQSLLADTMSRVATIVDPARTLHVVCAKHERFYRRDLFGIRPSQVLSQPFSRGTAAAIAYALASIRAGSPLAQQALVGFFPADHYYGDPAAVRRTIGAAYTTAASHPDRIVIVGAQATEAETEYGWIQPGPPLVSDRLTRGPGGSVRTVTGFWEKPSFDQATDLLRQQCLWNTFISVGRVGAFTALLEDVVPDLWSRFVTARSLGSGKGSVIETIYAEIGPSDFSHAVLSSRSERLAVVELTHTAGWTDLGRPARAMAVLNRHNLRRPVLRLAAC